MKPKFKFELGQFVQHVTSNKHGTKYLIISRYFCEEYDVDNSQEIYHVRSEDAHIIPMKVFELKEYEEETKTKWKDYSK